MVSTYTTNKNLERPGNGDYVDTWNVPVNADLTGIDAAFGTTSFINATAGSRNLTVTEYQGLAWVIQGAISAPVTLTIPRDVATNTTPVKGCWVVRNDTTDATGGPHAVVIASIGGGTSVTLIRGKTVQVYCDGTNVIAVTENVASLGTVTSVNVSGGTTGLTFSGGPITTSGTITMAGTLDADNGGTGQTTYAVGDILYASTTSALSRLADVATGNALISGGVGVAPSWGKIGLTTHVSGTLPAANGGTGIASYTVGDIIYASGATTLAALADVATGNVLISGGVGVAPAWGKVGLTTHVSGTLPVANGGTGVTTSTGTGSVVLSASPTFTGTPAAPTASAGTNTTQLATTAFVTSAIAALVTIPSGVILMWSGSVATIPAGWVLCDGNNSTPDLRNRFIVGSGTGSSYAVGATGGSDSVTLSTTQIPGHTHTFSATTGNMSANATHTHTINDPGHSHTYTVVNNATNFQVGETAAGYYTVTTTSTGASGTGISINSASVQHTHTVSGTTDSTGGGLSHENRPPYYALCYIMKS
jgi:microcystin-dependent protein